MKDQLRQQIMTLRNALSEAEVAEQSRKIQQKLFTTEPFEKANVVLFYVSYGNEVATHSIIRQSLADGKTVVVPVTDVQHHCLQLSRLTSWDDLEEGPYAILQPKKSRIQQISLDEIEVVLVPGDVFDGRGHRIGHGEGYYDGLLKRAAHALTIGLAYEFQIIDNIPFESHDIPVKKIITEKRSIHCA